MKKTVFTVLIILLTQMALFADYEKALSYYQNGDYTSSLKAIAEVLVVENDNNPASENYNLRYLAAHCLWKMKSYDRAMIHFHKVMEMKDSIDPYIDAALMMLEAGRSSDAASFANKVIEKNSSEPIAYYVLGGVHHNFKNYDKSKEYYEKALALDPEMYASWNGLGKLLYSMENYSESVTAFSTALAMNSTSAESENNLAMAYYQLDKFDLAKEHIAKALELKPDNYAIKSNFNIINK